MSGGSVALAHGPRRWRPTALHSTSAALHLAAGAGAAVVPDAWPWALGAVLANHAAVAALTLRPANRWFGPVLAGLPADPAATGGALALTFDDGPDPLVTPGLLDLLAKHRARATFFCIGRRVEQHPQLVRAIAAAGHDVENHSWAHSAWFGFHGPARLRIDIARAQMAIADATGRAPVLFRPPFGVRTPWLEPVLAALGLHCTVWTARGYDTVAVDAQRAWSRIEARLRDGAVVLLHDGIAIHRRRHPVVVLEVVELLLARSAALGLRTVTLRSAHGL